MIGIFFRCVIKTIIHKLSCKKVKIELRYLSFLLTLIRQIFAENIQKTWKTNEKFFLKGLSCTFRLLVNFCRNFFAKKSKNSGRICRILVVPEICVARTKSNFLFSKFSIYSVFFFSPLKFFIGKM